MTLAKRSGLAVLTALTWAAGNLSPLLLFWIIWPRAGVLNPPGTPGIQPLAIDFALAVLFPLQHSLWTQTPVKAALRLKFTDYFERPMYVITSGLALGLMWLGWQSSSDLLWTAPAGWVWTARGVLILTLAGQVYCSKLVGTRFLTGLTHLKAYADGEPVREPVFKELGPYRRIRHPIATCQLIMIWCIGSGAADRVLLAIVWTVWIITATALEDLRLGAAFGETYKAYRRRAGFLWPRLR